MPEIDKPFDVTKAVDFTDAQIAATWVDLPGDAGFFQLADPRSPMPLMLLGGKGSGRTHLMRYFSYALQKLRAGRGDVLEYVRAQGYIGVYMRCEGLNAGRFEGKGQSADVWMDVFPYAMDLWIAQLAVETLGDACSGREDFLRVERAIALGIAALFDVDVPLAEENLAGVVRLLAQLRREVDVAVNNAALTRSLEGLRIRVTRGRLVFGIPQLFAEHLPVLNGVQIVYLIDELENLAESQQLYINTLLREKEAPATFKVGSRLYGFRTQRTLSAGEENRVGSEYEQVILDDLLRVDARYDGFARTLVAQRLRRAGYATPDSDPAEPGSWLDALFEQFASSRFERDQTAFVAENYEAHERPYLVDLRNQLASALKQQLAPGVATDEDVIRVVDALACVEFPLLEKANIFLLYQDWSSNKDLPTAAREIREACSSLVANRGVGHDRHNHVLSHFKGDLLAQMLRRGRQRQRYLGLQTFIDMSSGLPRHLIIVLKFVHRWALFHGEKPFHGAPVSMAAQHSGVVQAANWFFEDARATGSRADAIQSSVERLARFFHELRYSDKPVESSLTTFSFKEGEVSGEARQVIELARNTSLLLRVLSGAKDRNEEGVVAKYQLNPMLCPRFDLPLSRRGTVALSPDEVEAIFGEAADTYDTVVSQRLARMNAPFRAVKRAKTGGTDGGTGQGQLPGLD